MGLQNSSFYIDTLVFAILFCLFAGFCKFAQTFVKDTEDSLREISQDIAALPRKPSLLERAVLREKLRVILRFKAESIELSAFSRILFINLTQIHLLHFRLINDFSEFFSILIGWFFFIVGAINIPCELLLLSMVKNLAVQQRILFR